VDRATKRKALAPFLPHAEVTDREEFMSTSNGFHAVLANLSGNKVLTLVLQAITHVVVEHIVRDLDPLNERDEIGHDHADIGQAVLDGKGATAQRLMAEHIGHIIEFYRTQFPAAVQELIAWR
jgi:DNA-binding GntR family transcriptional regulator